MAARRLIAIVLVLLITSSLAAALAPSPDSSDEEPAAEPAPVTGESTPIGEGRLLRASVEIGADRRPLVRARVGDQLQLRVKGSRALTVELLGETEGLTPTDPATLDLLLRTRGEFPIQDLQSGRLLGTLVVEPPKKRAG